MLFIIARSSIRNLFIFHIWTYNVFKLVGTDLKNFPKEILLIQQMTQLQQGQGYTNPGNSKVLFQLKLNTKITLYGTKNYLGTNCTNIR